MALVSINGTALPEPSAHDLQLADIHGPKSGRSTSGYMILEIVRRDVRSLALGWQNVTQAQAKTILDAISGDTFTVYYNDPDTGTTATFTAYKGDRKISPYTLSGGKTKWLFSSISVNLVEV